MTWLCYTGLAIEWVSKQYSNGTVAHRKGHFIASERSAKYHPVWSTFGNVFCWNTKGKHFMAHDVWRSKL